ncbi:MAG: hypothetical protein K2X77_33915, partial [Candidatus Obscuribacterales bacterium]|nr:hypothetical protein [Candidatus Obscuribacterales bacterium]
MAAGDKKADSIPPSEKEKDEKKNGGDPTVDAAFKLLNESQAKSKTTEAQVTTALMAKMNASGDLLTSTVKQDFIVKTGNDYADFGLNLGTGAVRNLAEFGKTIAKSVKDPLSVIHDVGSVGAAVVENPNAVKEVIGDGLSKMAFQKGAAEAGNTWGNVLATVGTLWGGARGAVHKVENKAVAGAGSIEQKLAQTNKLLSSVETNVTRLETAAVGPAPRLAEAGLSKPLATRLDGLSTVAKAEAGSLKLGGGTSTLGEAAVAKMEGGTVKIGESAAAKLEGGVVKPLPKEPLGTAPKLDTVRAPKVQEPVLREPVREVSPIKEPIKPTTLKEGPGGLADDAAKVKAGEPVVKPGAVADDAAKVKTAEPVKPGTVADDAAKVKTGEPVKPGAV